MGRTVYADRSQLLGDSQILRHHPRSHVVVRRTFPTAASPSRTSLTLLLGFGAVPAESAIAAKMIGRLTRQGTGRGGQWMAGRDGLRCDQEADVNIDRIAGTVGLNQLQVL